METISRRYEFVTLIIVMMVMYVTQTAFSHYYRPIIRLMQKRKFANQNIVSVSMYSFVSGVRIYVDDISFIHYPNTTTHNDHYEELP